MSLARAVRVDARVRGDIMMMADLRVEPEAEDDYRILQQDFRKCTSRGTRDQGSSPLIVFRTAGPDFGALRAIDRGCFWAMLIVLSLLRRFFFTAITDSAF